VRLKDACFFQPGTFSTRPISGRRKIGNTWRLELFGRLRLSCGDLALVDFGSRKAAELLALLALSERHSLSREALIARLWPQRGPLRSTASSDAGIAAPQGEASDWFVTDPQVQRNRLRTELSRLRRALETIGAGSLLKADRERVALVTDALVIDVAEFQTLRRQAARADRPGERAGLLDEAVRIGTGVLDRSLDAEVFVGERDHLASAHLAALIDLAQAQETLGEIAASRTTLQRAVEVAPHSEEAHFHLLRSLVASGQDDAARRHYDSLLQSLQGADPPEVLRALVAPLYGGRPTAVRPPGSQCSELRSRASENSSLTLAERLERSASYSTPRLPYYSTAFFGREPEIDRLVRLLVPKEESAAPLGAEPQADRAARLVTLTGLGGVGKTRLAVETARRVAPAFHNAVWFLSLTDLRTPDLIPAALLGALNMAPQQADLLAQAALALNRRPSLLLLDNLEHLLPAASEMVARLMTLAPTLCLLVTSRHTLHLSAGIECPLAPLPVPPEASRPSARRSRPSSSAAQNRLHASDPLDNGAVALFVDRARTVRSGFATYARCDATVVSICRELEGIPLALEIAAARAASFTPSQILRQIRNSLLTLRNRNGNPDSKHWTLEGMMAGSYRLLTQEQQRLFRSLAIFRGFSMEAACAVCGADAVSVLLQTLMDRSLVAVEVRDDAARCRLLEIPRAFGEAQWSEAERSWLTNRHHEHFLQLAETAAPRLRGPQARYWLDRLEAEHDNLRAALERSRQVEQWERALQLASALAPFWEARSYFMEGLGWLGELLPYAPPDTALRARALYGVGVLANRQGDSLAALEALQEALAIQGKLGDEPALATTLHDLGMAYHLLNRFHEARDAHAESVRLWRLQPDPCPQGLGRALHGLAMATRQLSSACNCGPRKSGETLIPQSRALLEEAARLHQQSQALLETAGDQQGVAWSLTNQGIIIATYQGKPAARSYYQRSLDIYERLGDRRGIGSMLHMIGTTYPVEDPQTVETLFEGLRIVGDLGERKIFTEIVRYLAYVEYAIHRFARGVRLLAAVEALSRASNIPLFPGCDVPLYGIAADWARRLPTGRFEPLWAEGISMSYDEILTYALSNAE
jgi:predicted ATPase/DNA-binding SARP family transcriptional activator